MGRVLFQMGCWLLLGVSAMASAAAPPRPWASMLLSGYVDINPDGGVRSIVMDHQEKIPPVVLGVIGQTAQGWRFRVDVKGKVIARARVSLRIVAKPVERTKFAVEVEGVEFTEDAAESGVLPYDRTSPQPRYPGDAVRLGTAATVYVLARIGRDGHVLDAGAEQVNFTMDCPSTSRSGLENEFAMASVSAIRQWTFKVPTKGPLANAPYWYARIPVAFSLRNTTGPIVPDGYGSWQPYLPGARRPLPWLGNDRSLVASAPDAIPDGRASLLQGDIQLAKAGSGSPIP